MDFSIDKNRPICPQIVEALCVGIANGKWNPHDRLPSVREIAMTASTNPNTVQRAFESLEADGIVYSVRGSGSFVAEDTALAKAAVQTLIAEKTAAYVAQMRALGVVPAQIQQYIKEWKYDE